MTSSTAFLALLSLLSLSPIVPVPVPAPATAAATDEASLIMAACKLEESTEEAGGTPSTFPMIAGVPGAIGVEEPDIGPPRAPDPVVVGSRDDDGADSDASPFVFSVEESVFGCFRFGWIKANSRPRRSETAVALGRGDQSAQVWTREMQNGWE